MPKPPHSERGKHPQAKPKESPQVTTQTLEWSGPLPPPAALEQFNLIIPNGAERILSMAEREQQHRMDMQKKEMEVSLKHHTVGQWLGAAVAIFAIAGAVTNTYFGGSWLATAALVGIPLVGVVQALMSGRRGQGGNHKP